MKENSPFKSSKEDRPPSGTLSNDVESCLDSEREAEESHTVRDRTPDMSVPRVLATDGGSDSVKDSRGVGIGGDSNGAVDNGLTEEEREMVTIILHVHMYLHVHGICMYTILLISILCTR